MNLSTDSTARMIASCLSGDTRPIIIIADTCNFGAIPPESILSGATSSKPQLPIQPSEPNPVNQSPKYASAPIDDDDQKPVVAPIVKKAFRDSGAMTTKQIEDHLINCGDMALLIEAYGEEDAKRRVKQALYGMKAEGLLTRADSKGKTPWVPTDRFIKSQASVLSDSNKKDPPTNDCDENDKDSD